MPIDDADLFAHLVVGLVSHARERFRYPYPDPLVFALNHLTARVLIRQQHNLPVVLLPPDMAGKLQLFAEPLISWWPGDVAQLPEEIDPALPLLQPPFIDESALDEQVITYLDGIDLPRVGSSLQRFQAAFVQEPIRELLGWARQAQGQRGGEYVTVRRFLIEHPWVQQDTLDTLARSLIYFDRRLLGRMYEPVAPIDQMLRHQGQYWLCPHCQGILAWRDGQPRCAKRVCGQVHPGYAGMHPLVPHSDLARLTWGIHTRVCVPGITELDLFGWLQGLAPHLTVTLWPGVDRYDLRVQFATGECWAIDVKDYESPESLGWHIHGHLLQPYPGHPDLHWDQAYYVVPPYRTTLIPNYLPRLKAALAANGPLPPQICTADERQFRREVMAHLARQGKV